VTTDRLLLDGLRLWTHLGVGDAERAVPQEIAVDLELEVDTGTAAGSDAVIDTVDYIGVVERVKALVEASHDRLVERLASRIADLVLADARVHRVQVSLRKRAGILPGANARAGIVLVRP
jgi:dihydroneopterin aldolase